MADDREQRRAARRRLAPLYAADVVCRLGLLAVLPLRHSGHLSGTGTLVVISVLVAGLLVCGAMGRRMSGVVRPAGAGAAAYRRLRVHVRQNHPVLYGAEIACWLSLAAAAIWRLFTDDGTRWASALWFLSLAGVFVCFVLMVRRDPEDRL